MTHTIKKPACLKEMKIYQLVYYSHKFKSDHIYVYKRKKKIHSIFIWSYTHVILIKRGKFKKNVMSIIISQYILNSRLLWVVVCGQKSNLRYKFKLELITTYHL